MTDTGLREHVWTRPEWRRLVESGALGKAKLVLCHGKIVEKMNIGSRHAHVVGVLDRQLTIGLEGSGWQVRSQNPIALSDHDEPEPDIAVCVDRVYFDDHPGPADVRLIIEVADSSVALDRRHLADYAAVGITEAWIVSVPSRSVEIHTHPAGDRYQKVEVVKAGSVDAAGVSIGLDTLFPNR